MKRLQVVILLALFYLAITSNFEPLNIVAAVLIAFSVSLLLQIERSPFEWRGLPGTTIAFARSTPT